MESQSSPAQSATGFATTRYTLPKDPEQKVEGFPTQRNDSCSGPRSAHFSTLVIMESMYVELPHRIL